MKNVLIIGATGQIGTELTMKLRHTYPNGDIVAGYIPGAEPKGELLESGPSHLVDITNPAQIAEAVDKYKVDTIYNLAALLSAVAENKPQLAWKIGLGGLFNTLVVAREKAPRRLLRKALRRRHTLGTFPGPHQLRGSSRWRHNRLCSGHLLCSGEGRDFQMPPQARHFHGHDVYARRTARRHRDYGG